MKNQVRQKRHTQSGSIFFWIFFMVILFAALSYALTQGFRGGGAKLTTEEAQLGASEVMSYGQTVRDGLKTLLINGVPLRSVSFEMATSKFANGTAYLLENDYCDNDRCKVFKTAGGNIKETHFPHLAITPSWWNPTWDMPGNSTFEMFDINGLGTSAPELVMKIVRVKPDICKIFNKMAGLDDAIYGEDQTGNSSYVYGWDTDDPLNATDALQYGYAEQALARKMFFCIGDTSAPEDGGDLIFVLQVR
jgi:hypothetical protein